MNIESFTIQTDLFEQIKKISAEDGNILGFCEDTLKGSSFDSFEEYLDHLKSKLTTSACNCTWKKKTLVARCLDCNNYEDSIFCLKCFLNGKHEGHTAYLMHADNGSCDCGNPALIKSSGFCSSHQHKFNIDELEEEEKNNLVTVFYSILYEIVNSMRPELRGILESFRWINQLLLSGDAVRRCCTLAFIHLDSFNCLIFKLVYASRNSQTEFGTLVSTMVNDPIFLRYYTKNVLELYPEFVTRTIDSWNDMHSANNQNNFYFVLVNFYLALTPVVRDVIVQDKIDWMNIFYSVVDQLFEAIINDFSFSTYIKIHMDLHMQYMIDLAITALTICNENRDNDKINQFIEKLLVTFSKLERIDQFNRIITEKIDDNNERAKVSHSIQLLVMPLIQKMKELGIYSDLPFLKLVDQVQRLDQQPQSVLFHETKLTTIYLLHHLAFNSILNKKANIEDFVLNVCKKNSLQVEQLVDAPLKWMAVSFLSLFDLFVRNSESFIITTNSTFFKINIPNVVVPTFSMIQLFLGIEQDKNRFLHEIVDIFGLFQTENIDDDKSTRSNIQFSALYFICCLIFDRYCLSNDLFGIKRLIVISYLKKEGGLTLDDIDKLLWGNAIHEKRFTEDLLSYASLVQTKNGSHFKLTNDSDWQPLLPFVKLTDMLEIISKFTISNKNAIIPFPEYDDLPYGIDLSSILNTPVLHALLYLILNDYVSKESTISETIQLIFNLLIRTQQIFEVSVNESDETVIEGSKENLQELIDIMPSDYSKFMTTKISYKGRSPMSMIDMIKSTEQLGITVLDRLGIHYEIPQEMNQNIKQENKKKAKAIQEKFMSDFKNKQDTFAAQNEEVELNDECSVCQSENPENPVLVFPVFVFETVIPIFAKKCVEHNFTKKSTTPVEKLFGFHLCGHFFHKTCINDYHKKYFNCPIDRCVRNNFLPKIDKKYNEALTDKELEANNEFIRKCFGDSTLNAILHSYIGELSLLEIRHRIRPECLDRSTNYVLFHYLFGSLFRSYHEIISILQARIDSGEYNNKKDNDDDIYDSDDDLPLYVKNIDLSDPAVLLLFKLFAKENPLDDYKGLVKSIFDSELSDEKIKPEERYQFLRMAALLQHFALGIQLNEDSNSSFIDWDDLLSFTSLCERYGITPRGNENEDEIDLQPFQFIQMPKSFLSFMKPPYSLNLADESVEIGICLLTGQILDLSKYPNSDLMHVKTHRKNALADTFDIILQLTGSNAGSIVLNSQLMQKNISLKGFYVDSFGDEDVGLKRGSFLSLSDEKLENTIESILSADWTDILVISTSRPIFP
ncbi:hypothetical protein M9Y10_014340 [Tritrichomonas musculus]|uniref:E3 ubiquitin-protein ligase n=1 Tax=Tritrichomonas musculus TaxID=1915356 RepID=A0ABR2KZ94_9EUKA